MKYICISLKSALDRRAAMEMQFAEHGLNVEFFEAIQPAADLSDVPSYDASDRMRRYGRPMSRGEVGCYLSHREVWKQLIGSNLEAICVMEDDIQLLEGFEATVNELFEHRQHWDIVRLVSLNKHPAVPYAVLPSGLKVVWTDRASVGTQCYLVTRAAAERLLEHSKRIVHAIDTTIDRHCEHRQRLLLTVPEVVRALPVPSTLGPRVGEPTFSMRMREKFFRRLDKLAAARYNQVHRPIAAITASAR
jgi:glycosyl transferase, family 25